jgi:hypothetical protein
MRRVPDGQGGGGIDEPSNRPNTMTRKSRSSF